MTILHLAANVLWIIALSIMAGASQSAWKRMDAETRVPMQFSSKGEPAFRLKRNLALSLFPAVAFAFGIVLLAANRNAAEDQAVIVFGVRATLAAVFALFHLRWLKAALDQLDKEGVLKS